MANQKVKHLGTWKDTKKISANVNGVWKDAKRAYIKDGGSWVEYYRAIKGSCKEYLDAGYTTDGVYMINPTGLEEFEAYCDMTTDGGGWTLLMNHNMIAGYFSDKNEALSYNEAMPLNDRYSILNKMGLFTTNGEYEFRLSYPTAGGRNIWKQSLNPLTTSATTRPVTGYIAISIDYSDNYWGGIEYNKDGGKTLLDGSVNHTNWWYAIGATPSWSDGTTYPGPNSTSVSHLKLWIR